MRLLLAAWTIVIFILTCTEDVYHLLDGEVKFVLNTEPHWQALLTLEPWQDISWVEFIGHFMMFFILTGILIGVLRSLVNAVVIAALYGIATEMLQPFFNRGAEGIDLAANGIGIMSCVVLYIIVRIAVRSGRKKAAEQDGGRARVV